MLISTGPRVEPSRIGAPLDRALAAEHGVRARTDAIETATMVRPADETKAVARMVELRGVEPAFRSTARVRLARRRPYSHALLEQNGALVRPELLTQLDVAVGDELVIGTQTFTIRGVLDSEPGRRTRRVQPRSARADRSPGARRCGPARRSAAAPTTR